MGNDIVWGPELKARVIGLVEAALPKENLILVSPYVNLDRLRYENHDYKDRCCHGCGAEHGATMRKPFCKKCFRELRG